MKLLIMSLLLLPTMSFAQTASNAKNSSQRTKALWQDSGVCGRQSDWSCLGHTVNAMCTTNPQTGVYGHCDAHGSDQGSVDCRCLQ